MSGCKHEAAFFFLCVFVSGFVYTTPIHPQESNEADSELLTLQKDEPEQTEKDEEQEKSEVLDKVNIDVQMVYGQYNNMLSILNFSQEQDEFVYYLRSYNKRSNDYGYKDQVYDNSSYYENSLEFIGNVSLTDDLTSIFQAGVDVDSHGMFEKEDYSREEKEKVLLKSKNIKKFSSSFEGYLSVGGAFYKHRLEPRQQSLEKVRNSLTRYTGESGGEIIWSAANRLKFNALYTQYSYTEDESEDDNFVKGEVTDDFKISNFIGVNFGLNFAWNRDNGLFAWNVQGVDLPIMPIAGLTVFGNDYYAAYFTYRYDLQPFQPEEYYYEQDYIYPTYSLPPAKVHHVEGRLDLRYNDLLSLKHIVAFKRSNNYYNYTPSRISENLLTAHSVRADIFSYEADLDFTAVSKMLRLTGGYKYSRYNASENITYHPQHSFVSGMIYDSNLIHLEWKNEFLGEVYVLPDTGDTLNNAVIGYLDVQFKTIESFYAYLRFENLYNSEYFLRDGYPEAGLTVLMGLRILI